MSYAFGIIGCGSIAGVHAEAIRGIEGTRIVGVASRSQERARAFGESIGCSWSTDYRELLQNRDIDIICLTTGSGSHYAIGMDVLNAGKHLLVEKPIAMTSQEADALISLAAEKGLKLSVVSQSRFIPHHQIVHDVVQSGKIGRLLLIEVFRPFFRTQAYYDSADWRGTLAEDGGALMNQGIHSIDLLQWIAGKPKKVIGRIATMTHNMEAEDMGLAMLTMENEAFATIMCSTSIRPGFTPSLNFYGESGTIKIEGPKITHWTVPNAPLPQFPEDRKVGGGSTDPSNINSDYHRFQIEDVIASIKENRRPLVTGEDGRNAVKLIEYIYQSSAKNGLSLAFSVTD
ncbi:Predicted dehydrogenase [Paenibacillus sp. yr247]|uniref:Gfo/Idh/MocA family protein n=1 Tax=Paenibacillus sp. yr247 TaxID=1761880 RepID=UPI00088BE243|nr:Gfo/Idh/MocA family oxidoreductase [Paenibacillus sp. yr247]SDO37472.1 Predicted dehydrogenase [Paenibacillus sp. yr247]